MPRFAANLTTMYQEVSLPDRFKAAADAGFSAIELLQPYRWSIPQVQTWLEESGLRLILVNTRPGLPGDDTVGLAAVPGREEDFKSIFREALEYAAGLGSGMIHVLAGKVTGSAAQAENTFIENIQWAADLAWTESIDLVLEPINNKDVPGYLYSTTQQVARIIEVADRENIAMQYDFYHAQIMEGNLAATLRTYLEKIRHVQFSSLPGRNEPQYGEVNLLYLFDYLDEIGYEGWIGCEYSAKVDTTRGLVWAAQYGIGKRR